DRDDDARERRDRAGPPPRRADRGGDLLPQLDRALRALLGQRRRFPQPALRDLLLPRHRLLHPRRLAAVRAGHARRAQDRARLLADRDVVVPLAARRRVRSGGRRVPEARGAARRRLHGRARPARAVPPRCRAAGRAQMIHWLASGSAVDAFPPVATALEEPNGLLAAGGDLSPARLLAAYRRGLFPWYGQGPPVLWWS